MMRTFDDPRGGGGRGTPRTATPAAGLIAACLLAAVLSAPVTPAVPGEGPPYPRPASLRPSPRETLLFDFGWKFHAGHAADPALDFGFGTGAAFAKAGEAAGAADPRFNDSAWQSIDLPHDWAVGLDFVRSDDEDVKSHGFKPVGRSFPATTIGWYRRGFHVAEGDTGRRFEVRFDGVFRDCIVWLNGHYLGGNRSGYTGFGFDLTDYLRYGQKNVLVVRVDASQYEGWFYEGAGIYRHAWLVKHDPVHIPQYGIAVRTELNAGEDRFGAGTGGGSRGMSAGAPAKVIIETRVANMSESVANGSLVSRVVAPDGSTAGETGPAPLAIAARSGGLCTQALEVPKPALWSPDHPELYTLVSLVKRGGAVVDSVATSFGIRTIEFDADSGFFLNGKRTLIKGVCCHQDHAGVGSALPDRVQYFRIERLKAMGANAYRTSHNPPTPELLEACDRLGMLVLDENRLMGSAPELAGQFRDLILRDRNHPSVILWSIGNEEWAIQNTETGERIARELLAIQRELDPTRVSTYAANNGAQFGGINSVIPVRGVNYMSIGDIDRYRFAHPDQPILGTEEASTLCTRGVYAADTVRGTMEDHDITGPSWGSTAEAWWSYYAARPWLAGGFVWTGFDYRGEPTPYGWPCINSHFGIMDVCGFPKNNFYYYKAWWSGEPVLQLSPHWNWEGREGDTLRVWVNSNCERVELALNGHSLGEKAMSVNGHLEWFVPYRRGTLEARGRRNGKTYRAKVETTGRPVKIGLISDRNPIRADMEDVALITVVALDSKGREVPDASDRISFTLDGPGKIIGVGNGDPSSHEPDVCAGGVQWGRSLFGGKCQVIVQSAGGPGKITLKAGAPGLAGATSEITAEKVARRPFVPAWEPVIVKHLGFGKPANYNLSGPSPRYPGTSLVDGLLGSADFRDGTWQGFEGRALDLTVDLLSKTTVRSVTVGCLSDNASWIFQPAEVDAEISDDGVIYRTAARRLFEAPATSESTGVRRISLDTGGRQARYVRVVVTPIPECPAWHRGAGEKAWLFVDEVIIE